METYERYKQAIDDWEFHGTEHYYKIDPFGPTVVTDGLNGLQIILSAIGY